MINLAEVRVIQVWFMCQWIILIWRYWVMASLDQCCKFSWRLSVSVRKHFCLGDRTKLQFVMHRTQAQNQLIPRQCETRQDDGDSGTDVNQEEQFHVLCDMVFWIEPDWKMKLESWILQFEEWDQVSAYQMPQCIPVMGFEFFFLKLT